MDEKIDLYLSMALRIEKLFKLAKKVGSIEGMFHAGELMKELRKLQELDK